MRSKTRKQVFYDAAGRRSSIFAFALWSTLLSLMVIVACFIFSVAVKPNLPELRLKLERGELRAAAALLGFSNIDGPEMDLAQSRTPISTTQFATTLRYAFFNNWDDNSFASLRKNADSIDVLMPEWLHLDGSAGDIESHDATREPQIRLWLAKHAASLDVMPLINNFDPVNGEWDGEGAAAMLASTDARKSLADNLMAYLVDGRFAGIVLDFKELPDESLDQLTSLVTELKTRLTPIGRKVLVVLPAYAKSQFSKLLEAADHAILLLYDEHWEGEQAGPLASQGWFEAQLDQYFASTAGEKLIVAIGSYAIDWSEANQAKSIPVQAAWDILDESGAQFEFDATGLNPTFAYESAETGNHHEVWMLDGVTMYNQMFAALAMEPAGIALWRLGTEDRSVWSVFGRDAQLRGNLLEQLSVMKAQEGIVYKGEGEILKAVDRIRNGRREVSYEARHNLITDEEIIDVPRSMTIMRFGHSSEKLIALTFDDGPSREYTPEILRILREKGVKATFFVVGANAILHSDILRQIYEDGHDLGNHTFTHPNLAEISAAQLDFELNATQRVLEAKLGVGTTLFRPPFMKDIEPETRDEARALLASAALGYITIGQRIDPLDWARPSADAIVRRTVKYALAQKGNVVLLHDGGGDRSQTITALPQIIEELRSKGFRFVATHELLGLSREEAMPPVLPLQVPIVASMNSVGFSLARYFVQTLTMIYWLGITLGLLRLTLVASGAWAQSRREKRRVDLVWQPPTLAVVVPAYNEELVICDSIKSILASKCPPNEIIVVDDGSTDATYNVVAQTFSGNERVRVYRRPNGGKSSALNFAIEMTDAEVLVAIDADSRLDEEALGWLARHFADPTIGAVAGSVHVGNQGRLITRFQALEYLISQNLDRRAFEMVNGISVVPGAIGAWRRTALEDVGGYDSDTLAEDADLTFKLERAEWKVICEPRALVTTEAPASIGPFIKQRFRWMYGMLQVAYKHTDVFRQKGARGVKFCSLPNIFLFQFLFALVSPVVDLMLVISLVSDFWNYFMHGEAELSSRSAMIAAYWIGFQLFEVGVAIIAFTLNRGPTDWSLLPLVVLQRFCYRQLIYLVAIRAATAAIRGHLVGWGKLQRFGIPDSSAPAP